MRSRWSSSFSSSRCAPRLELQHGAFTLIELLVAMAIFAMVLAAIYSTWILILRGSKSGLEAAAQVQRERVAIHTIEQTLSSVRSFAADLDHYSFVVENGAQATLSFAARLPESFPRGGKFGDFNVRRVQLSVENGAEGERDLVLRQWPILMDIDEDEQQHPLVLARNIKDFIVETWDAKLEEWSDTWEQTNAIPPLIKVTLSFNAPGQGNSYSSSSRPGEQISRVMSLPSVTVAATWQTPALQRRQSGNTGGNTGGNLGGNPGGNTGGNLGGGKSGGNKGPIKLQ